MTQEGARAELEAHNFDSYNDFLSFVEEIQKMSVEDKYEMLKQEYGISKEE